jgi:hypothetical protein
VKTNKCFIIRPSLNKCHILWPWPSIHRAKKKVPNM